MAWYTAPSGATAVAAYDAVGAASLADSYENEANPGTYTAAPGVAPTWAHGTGWMFNGTTQYLDLTGLAADLKPISFIARLTQTAGVGGKAIIASSAAGGYSWDSDVRAGGASPVMRLVKMDLVVIGSMSFAPTPSTNTVVAATYSAAGVWVQYIDGVLKSSGTNDQTLTAGRTLRITGQAGRFFPGSIAALAIYSGTLTLADVVAITAAMNALPVAAIAKGLPVIAHHYRQIFGG